LTLLYFADKLLIEFVLNACEVTVMGKGRHTFEIAMVFFSSFWLFS